jgi:peptidoglycan-N-acetylglucosamine deacetylase
MAHGGLMGGSAGILAAGGFLAYAVRGRGSSMFGPSVCHGDRTRRSVALTFDDGPSESTPALLQLLEEHDVSATFFMCGKNVERLPTIARDVVLEGHQVGNHSDTHPYFHLQSPAAVYRELARAQETITKHTGERPLLFRAPYGVRWFGLHKAQRELDLLGVMWSVLGRDWKWPAARIARLLVDRPINGDIICLHDGRGVQQNPDIRATLDALRFAIPEMKRRGFQFETVSELLCPAE